jgi:hypothetical protein
MIKFDVSGMTVLAFPGTQASLFIVNWWYTTVDPGYTGDTACVLEWWDYSSDDRNLLTSAIDRSKRSIMFMYKINTLLKIYVYIRSLLLIVQSWKRFFLVPAPDISQAYLQNSAVDQALLSLGDYIPSTISSILFLNKHKKVTVPARSLIGSFWTISCLAHYSITVVNILAF